MWPLLAPPWYLLPGALMILIIVAGRWSDWQMRGTATTLFVNWLACTLYVHFSGECYPVMAFFAADYSAAIVLLLLSVGRGGVTSPQIAVCALYAFELIVHGVVYNAPKLGIDQRTADYFGYQLILDIAWIQALVVAISLWRYRPSSSSRASRRITS